MSTNHTANYNLCQWEATDQVLRTDFNQDNAKIDAALKGLSDSVPVIATGGYTGNGSATRTISLGFTPKALVLCSEEGITYDGMTTGYTRLCGGLALDGYPLRLEHGSLGNESFHTAVQIVSGGFMVYEAQLANNHNVACNTSGVRYHYLAIG